MTKLFLFSGLLAMLLASAAFTAPDVRSSAFSVLEKRCNSCHMSKNPRRVFTLENMDDYARKINYQVFVKARMPKGKNNKLTEQEQVALQNWLTTIIN